MACDEADEPGFKLTGFVPKDVVIPLGELADNVTLPVRPKL